MNDQPIPPKIADRLLQWFCRNDLLSEIQGDLFELFQRQVKQYGLKRAKWLYFINVLSFLRPFTLKKKRNNYPKPTNMLRYNLLLAYRNFKRHKGSFFINLIGLSTGLTCTLLIYLWVNDELSVDKFHKNHSRLYQVLQNLPMADGILTVGATPGLLAESLLEEMPDIDDAVAVAYPMGGQGTKGLLSFENTYLKASELYAGNNYFNVFSYPLIEGDKDQVLSDKYSILLSEEMAVKLFKTTRNVVGKTVTWNRERLDGEYQVTGIFKNPPANSSARFDVLLTYQLYFDEYKRLHDWGNSGPRTYVLLKEGADVDWFNKKIKDFRKSKLKATWDPARIKQVFGNANLDRLGTLFLQRYSDKHLYNRYENGVPVDGRILYVRLFSVIALMILVIACINFMNLSTAKASKRLKEVGLKKSIGVDRKTLIFQFLGESVLMAFLSLILALSLMTLFLPLFNEITGKQLTLSLDMPMVTAILGITLVTGLLSGSYPAFYLSGFNPVTVLKGKIHMSMGELWARRGLVIFQFTLSVAMIVSVVVVYKQIEFVHTKNLGYNRDNIIYFAKEGKLAEGLETFLTEVKKMPGVVGAASFGHNLTGDHGGTSAVGWEGKNPDERIQFGNLEMDHDLMKIMGFEMAAGRMFSRDFYNENDKIIFNEAAINAMGLQDPIGKTVTLWGNEKQIIGVVKNFHFESLYEEVKPCFLQCYKDMDNILVKIEAGMEKETISRIQKFYQQYNSGLPFDYKFLDEDYQVLYAAEKRVALLSRYFAGIAILISCLGLFGLATFTAERRLKEIGIRKILGSSVLGIIFLLSGDFTKMVIAAILIAVPASYFIAQHWLEGFAFRIDLEWWFFAGAGLLVLFIAWFTVGMQTVKAAQINPAECLKDE